MKLRIIRRVALVLVILVIAGGGGLFWWNLDPERRFQVFGNDSASCANCRKQFGMSLLMYARSHEGRFPAGAASPLESLSLVLLEPGEERTIHMLSSHDNQAELVEHWKKHRRLSEDLVPYRYNEGLRDDDRPDAIVLYWHQPTHWECSEHKREFLGRPVMDVTMHWEFISEAEFARRQALTEELIAQRKLNTLNRQEQPQTGNNLGAATSKTFHE